MEIVKITSEQWKETMNSICNNKGKPQVVPIEQIPFWIYHFTNCLPPIVWGKEYVLCSEPYSYDPKEDKDTYIGFFIKNKIGYGVIATIPQFNTFRNEY
jgi:hypothetical protein